MVTNNQAQFYFSTITKLAYELQLDVFQNIYIWVALAFDATQNDDTSNPKRIMEQYCRLVGGSGTAEDIHKWEEVKLVLTTALLQTHLRGELSPSKLEKGLEKIDQATLADASPVVLVVKHDSVLKIVDKHAKQGTELVIDNLQPNGDYTPIRDACDFTQTEIVSKIQSLTQTAIQ